ncbi:MAG: ABC transporter permease [Candidatus Delongbacteria bacterium]|nr:ABC transporter permease [Candidatus Delongbacteria bacterium]MBN2836917.1 ABC transporter permease [Candidatus Delongbacteria bacterium]
MITIYSFLKIRFSLALQYRSAAIAGIFTQMFFGIFIIMVYDAFFQSTTKITPMTFQQTVSYIWLGQALLGLLPWNGDLEIQAMIKKGDFIYEWLRPISLYDYWFVRIFAKRTAATLLRSIPVLFIAFFCIPDPYCLELPYSLQSFFLFSIILTSSVLLGCTISNIITISTLFTIGDGIDRLVPAIVTMFSGMVIPLSFFPEWSLPIFKFLPFSGLVDTPYKFYLGIYNIDNFLFSLFHIFFWMILLLILGRYMINRALNRVVVMGG